VFLNEAVNSAIGEESKCNLEVDLLAENRSSGNLEENIQITQIQQHQRQLQQHQQQYQRQQHEHQQQQFEQSIRTPTRLSNHEEQQQPTTTTPTTTLTVANASLLHSQEKSKASHSRKTRKAGGMNITWDYSNPCGYCEYVHLKGGTDAHRSKCCLNGQALREPFPQLNFLPPNILHYARDRILHMGRNSVSYNSVLCCAATGVENNEGGGFDVIHGDHAVRLHGRTYHFLPTSAGNCGLNFLLSIASQIVQHMQQQL